MRRRDVRRDASQKLRAIHVQQCELLHTSNDAIEPAQSIAKIAAAVGALMPGRTFGAPDNRTMR
jgi:hypothetical protein